MKRYDLRSDKNEIPLVDTENNSTDSDTSAEMASASEGETDKTITQTDKSIYEFKAQIRELQLLLAAAEKEKLDLRETIALQAKFCTEIANNTGFVKTPLASIISADDVSVNVTSADVISANAFSAHVTSAEIPSANVNVVNGSFANAAAVSSANVNVASGSSNAAATKVIFADRTSARVGFTNNSPCNMLPNTDITLGHGNLPSIYTTAAYASVQPAYLTYADVMNTRISHSVNSNVSQACSNIYTSTALNVSSINGLYSPFAISQAPPAQSSVQPNQLPPSISIQQPYVRKLHDLPEFNGSPEEWPMFFAAFKETTSMYMYTDLENLFRLQKALKGPARQRVECLLIHPSSVGAVISTLEFHFGRPQLLIRSQIAKARAFPTIAEGNMSEIVTFSTMVSNLTAFLENAGAASHLSNPTLLDELLSKLPMNKREEWARYTFSTKLCFPSVRHFSNWLQEVAIFISIATDVVPVETSKTNEQLISKATKTLKPVLVMTESKCLYCKGNHNLSQCEKFKNMDCSDRWSFVKANHLCFSCLRPGHSTINCNTRRECGLEFCRRYHNRLLHERSSKNFNGNLKSTSTADNADVEKQAADTANVVTIFAKEFSKQTLFKFLPVEIKGPKGSCKVIAFVDDGSKISLIEEQVAKTIGLNGPVDKLSLKWIGGKTTSELSQRLDVEISGLNQNTTFQMRNVRTTRKLELPAQTLNVDSFKLKYDKIRNLPVDDYVNAVPQILIGMPHTNLVRPIEVINIDDCFSVHRSKLGYMLFGSNEDSVEGVVCRIDCELDAINDIQQQMKEYFTLENFGMKPLQPVMSEADKRAEAILLETTKQIGCRYETGLLWLNNEVEFCESYSMALRRLESLETKFEKNREFGTWYIDKINEYLSKSYARKLSRAEAMEVKPHTWYLPHFAVCNQNKENKLRLVFDATASVNGVSFNSRLMKGPDAYQPKPLLSILFKFRQGVIGVCADIREMFNRVLIRQEDQDAQRFLWRGGNSSKEPDVYIMNAMIFGSACSPCSAQYVKNTNAMKFRDLHPRATSAIIDRHYVDDYVDSFETGDGGERISGGDAHFSKQKTNP
ncbi:uncharacterized protein [Eurosta solidaginis]|uniref:uncharacterized protein n=1 Tax=Eurosta solidaginis TaxID=178769 RepID=UPI003531101E